MIRIRERRQLWQFVLLTLIQCFGSAWIRIIGGLLDPDPHGQIRIQIQEVKSSEIKLKSEKKIKEKECEEWKTEQTPTIVRILFIFYSFFLHLLGIFRHYLKKRIFLIFSNLPSWIRIRIHMDIFGIPDPDPHKNLCGSETLLWFSNNFYTIQ